MDTGLIPAQFFAGWIAVVFVFLNLFDVTTRIDVLMCRMFAVCLALLGRAGGQQPPLHVLG
jgi:hypothetical protein